MAAVSLTVNGKSVTADVDPRTLLVQLLREHLRLTGTHVGCDTSQCGACVVHVNGKAVKSCTVLAVQLEGADVLTIEGLAAADGPLHPMQEAFRENHGLQCGYCTPGMIMTAVDHGAPQGPRSRRPHHPRGARRQYLPLHRLSQYRQGDRRRSARHAPRQPPRQRPPSSKAAKGDERPSKKPPEETAMSATGIGAPVRRKEDHRFITGKGHYTDDISRPGQAAIYFIRSPHAHAKIRNIDTKAAAGMPGVAGVFTGAQFAEDKLGNLICGWTVLSKDGSPMKMAPHAAIAAGKANHVGDAVAVVIADTLAQAKDAAEKVVIDYEVLPAVVDPTKAAAKGAPLIHEIGAEQHDLQLAHRRRRRDQCRAQERQARHQARVHQQPAGAECDGAARRNRRIRCRQRKLDAVERIAEPARRPAGDRCVRRHGAREQAARDRARRRRRLRLEDLHLSGGGRLPVGGAQARPAGEVDLRALGELHHRRAWPRSRHQGADGVRRRGQDHRPEGAHDRQYRRLHVDLLFRHPDLLLCAAAVRAISDPAHLLRSRRGLHQHGTGRCVSRRGAPGSDLRRRTAHRSRRPRIGYRAAGATAPELCQIVSLSDRR